MKANNPLYNHVKIVQRDQETLKLNPLIIIESNINAVSEKTLECNYKQVGKNDKIHILQGSFHQGNEDMMGMNAGTQCCAMSIYSIVYCFCCDIE